MTVRSSSQTLGLKNNIPYLILVNMLLDNVELLFSS